MSRTLPRAWPATTASSGPRLAPPRLPRHRWRGMPRQRALASLPRIPSRRCLACGSSPRRTSAAPSPCAPTARTTCCPCTTRRPCACPRARPVRRLPIGRTIGRWRPRSRSRCATKLAEGLLLPGADLWVALHRRSRCGSSTTARAPAPSAAPITSRRLMYVLPTPAAMRSRCLGLAVALRACWRSAHQSNGQSEPLSRSWNRAYAAAGFERGDLRCDEAEPALATRTRATTTTPDLTQYRGHGELGSAGRHGRSLASAASGAANLRLRQPRLPATRLELSGAMPAARALRWYVQLFTATAKPCSTTTIDRRARRRASRCSSSEAQADRGPGASVRHQFAISSAA